MTKPHLLQVSSVWPLWRGLYFFNSLKIIHILPLSFISSVNEYWRYAYRKLKVSFNSFCIMSINQNSENHWHSGERSAGVPDPSVKKDNLRPTCHRIARQLKLISAYYLIMFHKRPLKLNFPNLVSYHITSFSIWTISVSQAHESALKNIKVSSEPIKQSCRPPCCAVMPQKWPWTCFPAQPCSSKHFYWCYLSRNVRLSTAKQTKLPLHGNDLTILANWIWQLSCLRRWLTLAFVINLAVTFTPPSPIKSRMSKKLNTLSIFSMNLLQCGELRCFPCGPLNLWQN